MDDLNGPQDVEARKRNIERRRETSRFAARDRRGKEADIFVDLKEVVPVVNEATVTHVDRIALLRVAASLCKFRKMAAGVLRNNLDREISNGPWEEETISECLDGFVLVIDSSGSILYITESVSLFLGLTQTDLTGRSIREFMHPADFDEYIKMQAELSNDDHKEPQSTVLRLKTVISPRGRNLNLKSALYKPISFLVKSDISDGNCVMLLQGCSIPAGQGSVNATANAMTKGGDTPNGTFMTRHTCDMRISYVSDTLNYILKSDTRSLMGTSFYDLVHPSDAHIVHKAMRELFSKGHSRSPYYRLISANNTLAWVMTESTTINHTTRGQKGQYVICIHYVLGIQGESESLIVSTDGQPAGIPVLKIVKEEIDEDEITKDILSSNRQPEIMDCVDFTPLISDRGSASYPNPLPGRRRCATIDEPRESRKSSYDEVLQWLFRDHPSSPAPQYGGEGESPSNSIPSCGPTLASACLPGESERAETTRQSGDEHRKQQLHNGGNSGAIAQSDFSHYSPLADGIAKCELRSPTNSTSPSNGLNQTVSPRLSTGPSGIHPATDHTRSVSTIPSTDVIPLRPSLSRHSHVLSDMQSFVSSSYPLSPSQAVELAYKQSVANTVNTALADLDFPFDDLTSLAPFVPEEELQPISADLPKDLQTLFPDLPDWTPAHPLVPAGIPARDTENHGTQPNTITRNGGTKPEGDTVSCPIPSKRCAYSVQPSPSTTSFQYEHSYMQPSYKAPPTPSSMPRSIYPVMQRINSSGVPVPDWSRQPVNYHQNQSIITQQQLMMQHQQHKPQQPWQLAFSSGNNQRNSNK